MDIIKNVIILMLATTLNFICCYELHIIPRNGMGLTTITVKNFTMSEIVLVIGLITISFVKSRKKKVFPSKLGYILCSTYVTLCFIITTIALFSNSSEPMRDTKLSTRMYIELFWPYILAIASLTIATWIGTMTIIRLFQEKKAMSGYLDNISELEDILSVKIHDAIIRCEEEMTTFSKNENDDFNLIHSKLQNIGLANLNSLKETESCKNIYKYKL